MKKITARAVSVILAVLSIIGILPWTGTLVYGAASYHLHKVDDIFEYAKNTEGGKMSYITNLSDSVIDIHHSDFRPVYNNILGRTCICLGTDRLPGKNKTASWKNIMTVTFRNAGYTSDGEVFDLECTLEGMKIKGIRDYTPPDNSMFVVSDVMSQGITSRAAYLVPKEGGTVPEYYGAIGTPYVESFWKFRVTDSGGKTKKISPIVMLFKDIDICNEYEKVSYRESVQALSGFAEDVCITGDSNVLVSENNSLFQGNGDTDTEDPTSQVLLVMNDSEAQIRWSGLTCGTHITPLSIIGYPVPDNTKTVDAAEAKAGENLHYTINVGFHATTDDNAPTLIRVTDRLNDILDAGSASCHVYNKDGADAGSEWTLQVDGQNVVWQAKNPASVQGSYRFTIDVKIRDDMVLDGRGELFIGDDGSVHYRIENTDNVEITDHNGDVIIITPPDPPETIVPVGGITLVKDVDRSRIDHAHEGDILNYTFTITNTGTISLKNITLSDSLDVENPVIDWKHSSDAASGNGTLSPKETVTGTAVYRIRQADINLGSVHNTATVRGTDDLGAVYEAEDTADTILTQNAGIDLTKTALPLKKGAGAGDSIEYAFEIANTGNVTLQGVTFEDDHELRDLTWDSEFKVLLPGQKVKGTASYVLTASDVDEGSVLNTASVTGTAEDGTSVTDRDDAKTEIEVKPSILLEKSADPAIRTGARAGDEVPFAFVITNTGNCTLQNVTVEDMLPGVGEVLIDWSSSGDDSTGEGELSAGESVTAEAFYVLTQKDIDLGKIVNEAAATGTDRNGNRAGYEDDAEVLLPENGQIGLVKESDGEISEKTKPGETIPYHFTVTNTGNVTLTGVTILDELPGLGTIRYEWEGSTDAATSAGTLSPGESVKAAADYELTQEDIDAGRVMNYAKAVGKTPSGKEVIGPDDDMLEIPYVPEISLVKEVSRQTYENVRAGDTLHYTLTAANTGNCTLTGVSFEDYLEGIGELKYDWSGAADGEGVLRPGELVRAQADYTISQNDINSGAVTNKAMVGGYAPDKTNVTAKGSAVTTLMQEGVLSVTKTANTVKLTDAKPGDEIIYTMVAENIGNLTVSNVMLIDGKEGLGELVYDWKDAAGEHILDPGDKVTVRASYKLTQEDIELEKTDNAVTVTGRTPDGKEIRPAEAKVSTPIERKDSIKVEKTADKVLIQNAQVGDLINYEIKVTNNGNTILSDVSLKDELENLTKLEYDWSGASKGEGILLPGESMTAKAAYSVAQKDIDSGHVLNTAVVTSRNGKGDPVGPTGDEAETKLGGKASFTLTKEVDKTTVSNAAAGDVLTYTLTGTNTGTYTLTDVSLKDTLKGVTAFEYNWEDASLGEGILMPGESVTATCTYTVTQADISNGRVENTAVMTAKQPDGKSSEKI